MDGLNEKMNILPKVIEINNIEYVLYYFKSQFDGKVFISYYDRIDMTDQILKVFLNIPEKAISEMFYKLQLTDYKIITK